MEHHLQAPQPPPVLDRSAQAFVDRHRHPPASRPAPRPTGGTPAAVPDPDVEEEWLALPGRDGERIPVRILRPAGWEDPLPVILCPRGPDGTLTAPAAHTRFTNDLALGADAAVVVPEDDRPHAARYPAAVEQSYAVARWLARHGGERGLDGSRMAVAGVSAGAHLAAALTLLARKRGGPRFLHQVLVCPVTDAGMDTGSHRRFADRYVLDRPAMHDYWRTYVPDPSHRAWITASPLRATPHDLAGLPPALVITAEADVLCDEGEAYAANLREAGVPVVSVRYHGTIHAFPLFDMLRDSAASRAARTQVLDTLHVALHSARP
ncbi:alpha/beta hydrolase [Streptomyces griseocarneus]|uniref:alpha/beta hydrolase n=1 Tax=Streptomyces griseocarneus TaxID=51201 RepID=UPI0019B36A7D|nr:alpha/beta hydrolase [Streptomyces griseocarneus]MBZ6475204.1 alpha/beta hydrolase [Streptomyces griseocarneus]GHG61676.1 esterase [Streptomyces griseocarneus]